MDRPEALRLADDLCAAPERSRISFEAAAELRRLHAENERLSATVKAREDEILTHSEAFYEATRLLSEEREKNERLLVALKEVMRIYKSASVVVAPMIEMNRAAQQAVKAVEGEKA